ncbi:MAG TPA: matrixin family metalloprotease [Polyangiaceae bacterium]|nr:matrixin family metalloprotease [Polyangiaceae bacterium]
MQRWILGFVVAGTCLVASDGHAFCRKTTCRDCPLDPDTGCTVGGQPLVWPGACVSYALSRQASKQVSLAAAEKIAAQAFDAWQSVTCPGTGEPPSIDVSEALGRTGCSLAEYSRTGANANVVLFRDDTWPYDNAEDAIGLTSVSFDSVSGQILDADVEINATVLLSTTDDVPSEHYDLLSILTHEAGHFLGLAHSRDPDAVMRPTYESGTASLRTPTDDDIAGICAIYPPGRRSEPCDFTPRGGFANECPLGVFKGGCALGPPTTEGTRRGGPWALVALAGALAGVRRRARRASRSR